MNGRSWLRRVTLRDTLFTRALLVQVGLSVLVATTVVVLILHEQASVLARTTAPLWSTAILAWQDDAPDGRRAEVVQTTVELVAGPPLERTRSTAMLLRYRLLARELEDMGLRVHEIRSGVSPEPVSWLDVELPSGRRWIGIRGEFEGADLRGRSVLGFALGIVAVVVASALLARHAVRPLARLRAALSHGVDGRPPTLDTDAGPLEVRAVAREFNRQAADRIAHEQARQVMLAGVSHDLRSPLGRIRMAAELLPDAPPVAARKASIIANVAVAERLLQAFISHAQASEEPLVERVDLRALALRVLEDADDADTEARLPGAPLEVEPASAIVLERMLRNLLENAFVHGAPPVSLVLDAEAGAARLVVRDHGPGIAAADRERLLQPFQRGDESRRLPGSGLGLATVRKTVERHAGTLELGAGNPGLVVTVTLPIKDELQ